MDDTRTDSDDDLVTSVPLPTNVGDGADKVIAQQNQSPEVGAGGGEWPSPDAPPTGPAPGTAGDAKQDTGPGPDRHPDSPAAEDEDGAFPPLREALEADPVPAGTQTGTRADQPRSQLKGASRLPGPDTPG